MNSYTQTGGLWWGTRDTTIPFAKIELSQERISFSVLSSQVEIHKKDIKKLKKQSALIGAGLRIEHSIRNYPINIAFWSLDFEDLERNLENWVMNSLSKSQKQSQEAAGKPSRDLIPKRLTQRRYQDNDDA